MMPGMIPGAKVKELRKKHNWSQDDLADRISVTRQYIAAIESGRKPLSLAAANDCAKAFGCSIEVFVEGL